MGRSDTPVRGGAGRADGLNVIREKKEDSQGRTILAGHPLFAGLSGDEHTRLLASARTKEFARGDLLFMDGDPVEEVLLLVSGLVKITKLGASGTAAILSLTVPGDVLGPGNLFFNGKHTATAESLRSSRVLAWRAPAFKAMLEGKPVLLSLILRAQAEWLEELEERFHEMATDLVGARVARQLLRLHRKMVQAGSDQVEIHLSHEELAQMTGTNLYTISRLFSEWEGNGVVRSSRQLVMIRDVESLRDMYDRR